jgi:hypothetical protein
MGVAAMADVVVMVDVVEEAGVEVMEPPHAPQHQHDDSSDDGDSNDDDNDDDDGNNGDGTVPTH